MTASTATLALSATLRRFIFVRVLIDLILVV